MQELTERTHEYEEKPSLKYSCSAALEEDWSPTGSPRPLLANCWESDLGDRKLVSLLPMLQHMPNWPKLPLCVLQTASNADTVVAAGPSAGESIWQGLEKSDQIFKRFSHPRLSSAPKPRFRNINMIVSSDLHHP